MARATTAFRFVNVQELLHDLGDIAPERVRLVPPPGRATEADLIRLNDRKDEGLFELVEGTLVAKIVSFSESGVGAWLIRLLGRFLDGNDLGFLTTADGAVRLLPGLVRVPDLAFFSWDQSPGSRFIPTDAIGSLAPALAVEVLSPGNTRGEMTRKLKEYFLAGTRLVWLVNPRKRNVTVHTAPDRSTTFEEGQTLDGGDVLPGLSLPVADIFVRVPRETPKRRGGRKNNKDG
jgi:Uma2 family endonuclease